MEDFKYYIGVKMLGAIPMTKGDAHKLGYFKTAGPHLKEEVKAEEGYLCDNGKDICWKSKVDFERNYFPIEDKTKISRNDVEAFLVPGIRTKLGEKTCVIVDSTITGFDTIGTSACVDPANYDQEKGEEIARRDIVDKVWGHLGFVLQWAKNGLKDKDTNK